MNFLDHDEYTSMTVANSELSIGTYIIVNTFLLSRYAIESHLKINLLNKLSFADNHVTLIRTSHLHKIRTFLNEKV